MNSKTVAVFLGELRSFEERGLLAFAAFDDELLHPVRGAELVAGVCVVVGGDGFLREDEAALMTSGALRLGELLELVEGLPHDFEVHLRHPGTGTQDRLGLVAKSFTGRSSFAIFYGD